MRTGEHKPKISDSTIHQRTRSKDICFTLSTHRKSYKLVFQFIFEKFYTPNNLACGYLVHFIANRITWNHVIRFLMFSIGELDSRLSGSHFMLFLMARRRGLNWQIIRRRGEGRQPWQTMDGEEHQIVALEPGP